MGDADLAHDRASEPFTLPDLTGRTALVTGASDGVGREIARALAEAGAGVILPVRNREKGARAIARIRETAPDADLQLRDLDLARLDTVERLAQNLLGEGRHLDFFVMNAGVVQLGDKSRRMTADGFELHFQTNFLGHAALTLALLPLLERSATRIAVQGSLAARTARLNWGDLPLERGYMPLRAYGQSKLALALFGVELERRTGLAVNLCHPGVAPDTAIAPVVRGRTPSPVMSWATSRLGNPPAVAAQPALLALTTDAASPCLCVPSGRFQVAGRPRVRPVPRKFADAVAAARVWETTAELLAGWRSSEHDPRAVT